VSVPLRADAVGFAATVKATVPLPEYPLPDVIVIQVAFEAAVQAQPVGDWTSTELEPPAPVKPWVPCVTVKEQDGDARDRVADRETPPPDACTRRG